MSLITELRFALRRLGRSPVFTAAAVLTLAVGLGGTTAIFAFVEGILLAPLPYPSPQELKRVDLETPSGWTIPASPATYAAWRELSGPVREIAAVQTLGFDLEREGEPLRVQSARVSASLFPLLGATPLRGRLLNAGDDTPGAAPAAVLSHGAWQRLWGGDPELVGESVVLDGTPHRVAGVLPREFHPPEALGLGGVEIWTALGPAVDWTEERSHFLAVLARLHPVASAGAAGALFEAAAVGEIRQVALRDLTAETLGDVPRQLLLLFAAAASVLLIVCANVAGLLIASGAGRRRERSVRVALGARGRHLLAERMAESLLLAGAGGGLGVLLAMWLVDVLVVLSPADVPRLAEVRTDPAVFAFALALALVAGLLTGLAPALAAAHRPPAQPWAAMGRGATGAGEAGRRLGLRQILVAAEVALALVLVTGAGLLAKSLYLLGRVDPGFEPAGRTAMAVDLGRERYTEAAERRAFAQGLLERVAALPGVAEAALISELPLSGRNAITTFEVEGVETAAGEGPPTAGERQVSPGYFSTAAVPLLAGRGFTPEDGADGRPVVVVNRRLARRFWPGGDAVGRWILLGAERRQVVGVVQDVHHDGLGREAPLEIYTPFSQIPRRRFEVVVRHAEEPGSGPGPTLADALRQAVWSLDPRLPVLAVRPVEAVVAASLDPRRSPVLLVGSFAGIALFLAALGVYGQLAFLVESRRREIGIRMALGAARGEVVRWVVGQGAIPVALGLAAGLAAALASGRLLASQLFAVRPADPVTFAGVTLVLAAVALAASYLPARRAAAADPARVLQSE